MAAPFCSECSRKCEMHGLLCCALCHSHEGECDYGACGEVATHTISEPGHGPRPFCTLHATADRFGFARAGAAVKLIEAVAAPMEQHRHDALDAWAAWADRNVTDADARDALDEHVAASPALWRWHALEAAAGRGTDHVFETVCRQAGYLHTR